MTISRCSGSFEAVEWFRILEPVEFPDPDLFVHPFQRHLARVLESESLARDELSDDIAHEHLVSFGAASDPCRCYVGRSEKFRRFLDRLTGFDANSDGQRPPVRSARARCRAIAHSSAAASS